MIPVDFVLADTIHAAQMGDRDSMLVLLNQFNPLLNKYAWKINLDFDDAKQELVLAFIELIQKFKLWKMYDTSNKTLIAYISKSVHYSYVTISKRSKAFLTEIFVEDITNIGDYNAYCDSHFNIYTDEIKALLNEKEFAVFYQHYMLDKSIAEIALNFEVSRQSVNRIKLQAKRKIEMFYSEDA